MDISVSLSDVGITKSSKITNLWTGKAIGKFEKTFSVSLAPHASGLYVIK
jgi:hypothetical protein